MKKKISVMMVTVVLIIASLTFGACTQAERVSRNMSQEADNFNVRRRLTVFNTRTDAVLFQMTGYFSIETDSVDKQLEVTCEIGKNKYSKHFVALSRDVTYVVEDLNGAEVSKYSYELNFMPRAIPGVKIVSED